MYTYVWLYGYIDVVYIYGYILIPIVCVYIYEDNPMSPSSSSPQWFFGDMPAMDG